MPDGIAGSPAERCAALGDAGRADAAARDRAGARAWWIVAGLLIAAFLARAPLYLSVLPPFEAWDEYQHLAYIAYLDETGSIPLSDSRVPLTLRPLVVSMPHSQWGGEQVAEWGALPYDRFWDASPPPPNAAPPSSPRLYQAQHPPLAYAMAMPIWRALKETRPLEAIYAIRALNLLLVAASLAVFAAALRRVLPPFALRVSVLALVCLHPLFFQNVARVANDGLAVAAGIAAISVLLLADARTLLSRSLLAAVCMAVSIWSKQTGLTLIPALVLGIPLLGWEHRLPPARVLRATSAAVLALLLLVSPLWLWNYEHYGSIVTTQESLELTARGGAMEALAAAATTLNWGTLVNTLFVPGRPWVGGWSFLRMNEILRDVHAWYWSTLLGLAAVGGIVALWRGARQDTGAAHASRSDGAIAARSVCAAVVAFTALGMIHHALVGQAVFGRSNTNPWYFMTALPFLFVLLIGGLSAIHRKVAIIGAAALALLFVVIDLDGTWVVMPAGYTNTTDAGLQWSRLAQVHPPFLTGTLRWVFLAAQLGAVGLAVVAMARAGRSRVVPQA